MIKLNKSNIGKEVFVHLGCYAISGKLTGFEVNSQGEYAYLDNDKSRKYKPEELFYSEKEALKHLIDKYEQKLNKLKQDYEKSFETDSQSS